MGMKVMILSLAMSLTMAVSASPEMWYTQSFDDFEDGQLTGQDDWSGGATVQDEFFHGESGKSVNVTGNMDRSLPEHDGVQYVTFYFMLTEEANMDWKLYMGNAARDQAAAMGLNPDNETIHIHGGDEQMPVEVVPEQWHQFGAVLDFNSRTWKLYFDDMGNPLRDRIPARYIPILKQLSVSKQINPGLLSLHLIVISMDYGRIPRRYPWNRDKKY